MPNSNNTIGPIHYLVAGCWLIFVASAFVYLNKQRLVNFDEQLTLVNSPSETILTRLSQVIKAPLKQAIVHFYDSECHCTILNQAHKDLIDKMAEKDNFNIINIDVSNNSNVDFIPSTPAIAITDRESNLLYIGPYSTGLECSADDSLVDIIFENYRQGYSSTTIKSDAQGCYCAN